MKRDRRMNLHRDIIEQEIRNYHLSLAELEGMREEIIEAGGGISYDQEPVKGQLPGDPTCSKVMKLRSSVAIRETERRVEAVTYLIHGLRNHPDQNKIRMLEMKYFENRLTDQGIWEALNIDRSTFYRWKDQIIETVADRLGFAVRQ